MTDQATAATEIAPADQAPEQEILLPALTTDVGKYQPLIQNLIVLKREQAVMVFDYDTPEGNAAARSHVRKLRIAKADVDRARKEEKAESLAYGRRIDADAKAIEAEIEKMILVHQEKLDEIEKKKADRAAAVADAIQDIKIARMVLGTATSNDIMATIDRIRAIAINAEAFDDRAAEAALAKEETLAALDDIYNRTVLAEMEKAEAAELARKQAEELELLRKEKAERDEKDRLEREAREKAEAEATAEQQRKDRLDDMVAAVREAAAPPAAGQRAQALQGIIERLKDFEIDETYAERQVEAQGIKTAGLAVLQAAYARQKEVEDQEERERIAAEEAAEKENQALRERAAAAEAEAQRLKTEAAAAQAARDAEEKARRDREEQEEADRRAAQKKAANTAHQGRVLAIVKTAILALDLGLTDENVRVLCLAMGNGKIPRVAVDFMTPTEASKEPTLV